MSYLLSYAVEKKDHEALCLLWSFLITNSHAQDTRPTIRFCFPKETGDKNMSALATLH